MIVQCAPCRRSMHSSRVTAAYSKHILEAGIFSPRVGLGIHQSPTPSPQPSHSWDSPARSHARWRCDDAPAPAPQSCVQSSPPAVTLHLPFHVSSRAGLPFCPARLSPWPVRRLSEYRLRALSTISPSGHGPSGLRNPMLVPHLGNPAMCHGEAFHVGLARIACCPDGKRAPE
jgi:hypothetical protein